MAHRDHDAVDDLDRLLAEPSGAAPSGLSTRVLHRAQVERRSRRIYLALAVNILALLGVIALAALASQAIASGEARDLVALAAEDPATVRTTPTEYFTALAQALPWPPIAALALDLALVVGLSSYLLHVAASPSELERVA